VEEADYRTWSLLGATVRSDEDWRLRARCLEVLGMAAGSADRQTAEAILEAVAAAREPSQ
jgi:hypothetical protein